MRNTKVILNTSCSNDSIQDEGEPRRRVPQCSHPELGADDPPPSKSDPRTSVTACQGKRAPDNSYPHFYTACEACDDVHTRTASSNVEHHHSLWVQEQLAGDGWQETRHTCSLQAYEHQPI